MVLTCKKCDSEANEYELIVGDNADDTLLKLV
jgi:hypothetical protein